jgi:hypothetical protein
LAYGPGARCWSWIQKPQFRIFIASSTSTKRAALIKKRPLFLLDLFQFFI